MQRTFLVRSARVGVFGLFCTVLCSCAAVDVVSPGARGLTAEQSAWIISDDDVQIVSLDGSALHGGITLANDAFLDGVRDKVQVEPGSHELVVRMDNGVYFQKDGAKLNVDAKAGTTYHITVDYGPQVSYQVHTYAGIPDKALLQKLDKT